MPEYRKMGTFVPINGDRSLGADFECWHPSPDFAAVEQPGSPSWLGGTLGYIKAEAGVPFVDLPAQLEHMIKHCWKVAAGPSNGVTRGRVAIGAPRQTRMDMLQKSMNPADIFKAARIKAASQHTPQVQPMMPFKGMAAPEDTAYLNGVARDWKMMQKIERVSAYTFRGDTRPLGDVVKGGGFQPPITRTDAWYVDNVVFPQFRSYMERRYQVTLTKPMFDRAYAENGGGNEANHVLRNFIIWQSMVQNETFHLGRMLASEALKGYTSTSRSTSVAKGFARKGGWVYLTLVQGGYLVPDQGKHEWTSIFGEQEIALPGPIPWSNIFAFRQISTDPKRAGKFAGPIYIRKGFAARNKVAFTESYDLLSGKRQR